MSLIAHWPLDGNTNDISGNNNHATNHSCTSGETGKIGTSYLINNLYSYVHSNAALYISTPITTTVDKSYTLMG